MRRAGYGGCALTDALWLGVAASLAAQLQKIHSPSASIKRPDHQGRYPPRIPGWERETLRPPRLPGRCACSVRCKKAASGCWVQTGPGRRRLGRPLWAVSMRVAGGRQVWSWGRGRSGFLGAQRELKIGIDRAGLPVVMAVLQLHLLQPHRNDQAVATDFRDQAQRWINAQPQQLVGFGRGQRLLKLPIAGRHPLRGSCVPQEAQKQKNGIGQGL